MFRRDLGVPPRRGVPPRSRCFAEISVFRRDLDVPPRRGVPPRSQCSAETRSSAEISVLRRDAVFRRDLGALPRRGPLVMTTGYPPVCLLGHFPSLRHVQARVQELCESRGGRPGLSVVTSLTVSVDVK